MVITTGTALPLLLVAAALTLMPGRVAVNRRWCTLRRAHQGPAESSRRTNQETDPLAVASVLELLAACLRAGLPMAGAARTVASEAPEPLGAALRRAADLLALGADAATAWEQVARDARGRPGAEEIESLARMARRSARSGSSLSAAVTELAEQRRSAAEDTAAAKAERAGVLIAGPLGLCFLPAFVCLGIVPVVIGLAGRVLDGGLL
ncbi:type II secretion system F family protein [Streptomyces gardneri]|uniref:type II secretion system F family protein n=1 Tax=Nocardia TaxID=1817 RepID=UPI00135C7502|nr:MULTISPECIES: type II secretion system F family protein [Nocardia]MBF6165124.1 type II secretion system F family protein [Streptomyces gardneri]MBF6208045.1 type II secretion system F family protein [Streptomyces gardneri]UAK34294.1 type II secretion system F family protein [Nocardia asteroides]